MAKNDRVAEKPEKPEKPKHLELSQIKLPRWIGLAVADYIGGALLAALLITPLKFMTFEGEWAWLPDVLNNFLTFAGMFIMAAVFLRVICKTSLKTFIAGEGGEIDWRRCGVIALLYLLGFGLNVLICSGFGQYLSVNEIGIAPKLVSFGIAVVFTWMQTTWEELAFRGLFLRWACGNKISPTARCIGAGVVSTLLFMAMHAGNPEVLAQSGAADIVMTLSCYFLAGAFLYLLDVAYGDLMPGCVCHWVNNFMNFAFFNQAGTVVVMAAFFVDSTPVNPAYMLVSTVIVYAPVLIYTAVQAKKGALRHGC